ncbi:MAG: stage II sporulation protein R [Clostridia bacterium]|nr:stage II sporulation protein R [Clostridia bacterium]
MSKVLFFFKGFRLNQKFDYIKLGFLFIALITISSALLLMSYSQDINKGLADNLIRLHVVANSDSPEDQDLKLKVRDAVVNYMKEELKNSKDIEETKFIIRDKLPRIEEIARTEVKNGGKSYSVKAGLGAYAFPTKLYGDITLPAGEYQALKVEIGNGTGANWWCVLFPPLCFVDATHGTVPDSVKQDLKNALTDEEYRIITSASSDDEIPIKVRFKVVEFFQDSKVKFSGMISKVFK